MIRPSALPMLALCPRFEGAGSRDADEGTLRHEVLAAYLKGDQGALQKLPEQFQEGIVWAAEYIQLKAPTSDHPLVFEKGRTITLPSGLSMPGTPDITCGDQFFDLKWRVRDYRPQVAAYALMLMHEGGQPQMTAHLLFAESQHIEVHRFDPTSAWDAIKDIIAQAEIPWSVPVPNDFCGWCKHRLSCPALNKIVNDAILGRPDWELSQWHSSEITDAKQMGRALRIARCLADWCESVEHHAREMATKQGVVPEGFKVMTRQGARVIEDLAVAFSRVGLPQEVFLKACAVKVKALCDTYAQFHGMKSSPAEKEVERKLGDAVQRKPSTTCLVTDKPKKD